MENTKRLEIIVQSNNVFTYALEQNGMDIVRKIIIKNVSEEDVKGLMLTIHIDIDLVEPFQQVIDMIRAGEELELRNIHLRVKGEYLATLTERVSGTISTTICQGEEEVASDDQPITVLAYDEWPGLRRFPDLLAAFVTPNHPAIAGLLKSTSKWLEKWTGNPALNGYQSQDLNRIKIMAAAVYAAIQEMNITYAVPPTSFEEVGQRVRLCETVMEQHIGTCLDMTLLYASCLEAIGLHPILILMRGHIFAGVWLIEDSFADPIVDDPSQLEKRMARGIHELVVIECTAMCAGKTNKFDTAVQMAVNALVKYPEYHFAIDIKRARKSGVRPLPIRIKTDAGYVIEHDNRKEEDITSAPAKMGDRFEYSNVRPTEQATKQKQWERKLLDMSLRNMLINMRLTKALVPLLSASVSDLEDALADGEEFQVLPRPLEWELNNITTFTVENTNELGPYSELITLESKHKRLHSIYNEKELDTCLKKMYRSAKTSMEENGASTLYLALGLLRWFESKNTQTPRYAPIIMIPIEISRKSASKGYVLRMRDEEAQINITLLEFLKQTFDIVIGGLDPIPEDEHGVDIEKIFAIIRQGIMSETMWDVIESGFIGNFSFSQFVMWNDIHNKTEFLECNEVVHGLIKGAVDWDCTIPETVDTDEAYLPVAVDSSQLRAINMAEEGISFVLHGPPGTGKSQTITAMIANALTKGKTVLFVAEKMAALEVVQKRLEALGIGDFCLELHSHKATKKSVLNFLKKGLELQAQGSETDYEQKTESIRKMRKELDAYVQALHKERNFGQSLRELIDRYEFIPDHGQEIHFDTAIVDTLSQSDLDDYKYLLERLVAAGKAVGHPYHNPLSAVGQTVYSQTLKSELTNNASEYKGILDALQKDIAEFVPILGEIPCKTKYDLDKLHSIAKSILFVGGMPSFLLETDLLEQSFQPAELFLQKESELQEKTKSFANSWNEMFLRMDMESFRIRFEEANKKFLGKRKALAALTAELQAYASFQVVTEKIPVMLTSVAFYQQETKEVEALKNSLPPEWKELVDTYDTPIALQAYKEEIKSQLYNISAFLEVIRQLRRDGKLDHCSTCAKSFVADYETVLNKEEALQELLQLKDNDGYEEWITEQMKLCDELLSNVDDMKEWIAYEQVAYECRSAGLAPICEAYENGLPHEEVVDVYMRSLYRTIALSIIEKEPILNGFTGTGFNARIQQFKKLDAEFMELTKEEMFYKLSQRLPSGYESVQMSKELNILRRAISSNGRGLSLRALFEQIPNVLNRLCPCMLMSPISVAQYLAAEGEQFDIVIFDEASQLPTCKAVGVMARGKSVVIVGDPNQMPPTSFFAGNTVDEDNLDIEDLDSILDDCLALGMPQTYLKWHYRSRHESLIAFSNYEFYENQMLTFPSRNDRERCVKMVKVEGCFERGKGRVNEGEAKAIVNEVIRRYKDETLKNRSIGVVTFNISQQALIEDLLQEAFQKDVEFDIWANQGEESLFVKNLENVQGDERDIILFSVAFGPDEEGKLSMNFGPLNREGGWKRLNVAVSRARYEMVVFSTMTSDMIDLRRTKAKGVEALKDFLAYAEKGTMQTSELYKRAPKREGIKERICQRLGEEGYFYQTDVGHSDFKIDIAVVNPYHEGEYLLGILLDGESYQQSTNTKDREVAQISVLEGLGWELHRVWAMDWWDNCDRELDKLCEEVRERVEKAKTH